MERGMRLSLLAIRYLVLWFGEISIFGRDLFFS